MLKSVKDFLQSVNRLLASIILSDNDIYTVKVSKKKKKNRCILKDKNQW